MKLAIVITSFDRAFCVERAIGSALAQDYQDIEVVVFDDDSKDNTQAVVEKYFENPKFRYIRVKNNLGQAQLKNIAISILQYDAICFLDSDDEFTLDKVAKQVAALNNKPQLPTEYTNVIPYCNEDDIDIVLTKAWGKFLDGEEVIWGDLANPFYWIFPNLVAPNIPHASTPLLWTTALLRRRVFEHIGGFSNLRVMEDDEFRTRSIMFGHNIYLVTEPLYRFYKTPESQTLAEETKPGSNNLNDIHDDFQEFILDIKKTTNRDEFEKKFRRKIDIPELEFDIVSRHEGLAVNEGIPISEQTSAILRELVNQ